MNKIDIVALAVLFVVAFSLWTVPMQNDPRPFGEGDAAWHFAIGDYIAQSDEPIYRLPFYIGQWYYNFNEILGANAPEYPPPNHYNYGLMQVSGGERFTPILLYRAIASFLGVFAVYFLMSKLFGTPAAIIASTGLIFSFREQMIYLWGQQPTLISVVIIPITLYAFYRYLDGYYRKEASWSYLYAAILLLASQFLLHVQGFIVSAMILGFFTLFMFLKHRRIPFIRERIQHLIAVVVIFAVLSLPFILIYLGSVGISTGTERDFSRLFSWTVDHSLVSGSYPAQWVTFGGEYQTFQPAFLGSAVWFPLLLIVIGVLLLLARRSSKDLLMLAWLLGIYMALHTDVILNASPERAARMGVAEPALFYSLIAIGALAVVSVIRLPRPAKVLARYGIAAVLVVIVFSNSYSATQENLGNAYQSIFRLTDPQIMFTEWLNDNVPENAYVYYIPQADDYRLGQWQYQKLRWMLASSQRYVVNYHGVFPDNPEASESPVYFVFDYTDLALLASGYNPFQQSAQQNILKLEQFELDNFNRTDALYNKSSIWVYRIDPEDFQ